MQPHAPFRKLVTHGFTLDSSGQKMSKSLGNVITYQEIIQCIEPESTSKGEEEGGKINYLGPDVLRLWIASNDWEDDFAVKYATITAAHETLAQYRATIKSLLELLSDFLPSTELLSGWTLKLDQLPIERDAMSKLLTVIDVVKHHLQTSFDIHKATAAVRTYITHDLSDSYLEQVKDAISSNVSTSTRRISAQVTLYHIFTQLQQMLGPVVPLLVEESHDYTPEAIMKFAGHPFHRIWELPLGAQIMDVSNVKETWPQRSQLEARILPELSKADLAVGVSVEEVKLSFFENAAKQ